MFLDVKAKVCVISLPDVSRSTMRMLLSFIYTGEVSVEEEALDDLLQAAETLEIRGLTKNKDEEEASHARPRPKPAFDEAAYLEAIKKCRHVSWQLALIFKVSYCHYKLKWTTCT